MNKNKINFTCLVGTDQGHIKFINAYTLTEERQISLNCGPIHQIKKLNDQYFISVKDKINILKNIEEDQSELFYTPQNAKDDIVKFDFTEDCSGVAVAYKDEVHIVKDGLRCAITGGNYTDLICLRQKNHIAVGGDKTELSVYDLDRIDKPVFVGKTEANKELSLPAKVHITAMAQDAANDAIVYCGTMFNTVQMYDVRSSQRKAQSVANFDLGYAVKQLTSLSSLRVVAASARGTIGVLDFRFINGARKLEKSKLSRVERFSGTVSGVVSAMAVAKEVSVGKRTTDILLATSFDRHLRIYDVGTRSLLDKVYVGEKATCVLAGGASAATEEEVIWREMERHDNQDEEEESDPLEASKRPRID